KAATFDQGTSRDDPTVQDAMDRAVFTFSGVPGDGNAQMTLGQIKQALTKLRPQFCRDNRQPVNIHLRLTTLEHMQVLALYQLAKTLGVGAGKRVQRASRRDNRQAKNAMTSDAIEAVGNVANSGILVASNQIATATSYTTRI